MPILACNHTYKEHRVPGRARYADLVEAAARAPINPAHLSLGTTWRATLGEVILINLFGPEQGRKVWESWGPCRHGRPSRFGCCIMHCIDGLCRATTSCR